MKLAGGALPKAATNPTKVTITEPIDDNDDAPPEDADEEVSEPEVKPKLPVKKAIPAKKPAIVIPSGKTPVVEEDEDEESEPKLPMKKAIPAKVPAIAKTASTKKPAKKEESTEDSDE
jgi:hypothetical protein